MVTLDLHVSSTLKLTLQITMLHFNFDHATGNCAPKLDHLIELLNLKKFKTSESRVVDKTIYSKLLTLLTPNKDVAITGYDGSHNVVSSL